MFKGREGNGNLNKTSFVCFLSVQIEYYGYIFVNINERPAYNFKFLDSGRWEVRDNVKERYCLIYHIKFTQDLMFMLLAASVCQYGPQWIRRTWIIERISITVMADIHLELLLAYWLFAAAHTRAVLAMGTRPKKSFFPRGPASAHTYNPTQAYTHIHI